MFEILYQKDSSTNYNYVTNLNNQAEFVGKYKIPISAFDEKQ